MSLFRPLNVSERVPEVGDKIFVDYHDSQTGRFRERRIYTVRFDNRQYQSVYPGFACCRNKKQGWEINHFPVSFLEAYFAYCSRADGGSVEVACERNKEMVST